MKTQVRNRNHEYINIKGQKPMAVQGLGKQVVTIAVRRERKQMLTAQCIPGMTLFLVSTLLFHM